MVDCEVISFLTVGHGVTGVCGTQEIGLAVTICVTFGHDIEGQLHCRCAEIEKSRYRGS